MFHLVRGRRVLENVEYLIRSVNGSVEAVGVWTKDNWDVKRVISLYTMVSVRFNFKIIRGLIH